MTDLQHIQRLLEQTPSPRADDREYSQEVHSPPTLARQQRSRPTAGRKLLLKRQRVAQQAEPAAGSPSSPSSKDQSSPVKPWNLPDAEHSSQHAWHCEVCAVQVPRDKGASGSQPEASSTWQSHIEGIKHRRNALARHHSSHPHTTIVSTFETWEGVEARLPAFSSSHGTLCVTHATAKQRP